MLNTGPTKDEEPKLQIRCEICMKPNGLPMVSNHSAACWLVIELVCRADLLGRSMQSGRQFMAQCSADVLLDLIPKPIDGARLAVGRIPAKLGNTTHEMACLLVLELVCRADLLGKQAG